MISYHSTQSSEKNYKALSKRFRSLGEDLETLKKAAIEVYHLHGMAVDAIQRIPNYCSESYLSCKVVKFACKSLKGSGSRSGLRLIYVYDPKSKIVTFIELYFKSDKANNDMELLKKYLKKYEE